MKVATAPKLDQIDAERLRGVIESAPFKAIEARIRQELARSLDYCERSDVQIEIHRAQGAVAALRTVLGLPARLIEEIGRAGK